jgi:hypothetical protein
MTTPQVQALVDASAVGHRWAYDSEPGAGDWQGMTRLSCSLCIPSSKPDLILAARRRPRLASLYAEVEAAIGHQFRPDMPMSKIIEWADSPGPRPLRGGARFEEIPPRARWSAHGAPRPSFGLSVPSRRG